MFDLKKSQASLKTSASSIKEGGTLTTTVSTKNVDPGTTLYWTLAGIDSDDLSKGQLRGSGLVSRTGSFSFSHLFSEDLATEGTEKLVISLFTDKALKNTVTETSFTLLYSSTAPISTTTDLEVESHVIPARFSGKNPHQDTY